MMRLSVIIATMNRRDVLATCLERYRTQTERDFEIIVADNGSQDGTAEYIREHFPEVRVLQFEENIGPLALNRAAEAAVGEYLWRTDDDAYPETDETMAEAIAFMDAHPSVVAMTGEIIEPNRGNALVDYYPHQRPPGDAKPHGWPTNDFYGVSTILRRNAFLKVGGFWDVFYLEELDCASKLMLDGGEIRYVPWIRVVHLQDFHRKGDMRRRWLWQAEQTVRYQWKYFPAWLAAYRSLVVAFGMSVGAVWHRFGPSVWWAGFKGMLRGARKGRAEHRRLDQTQRRMITFGRSIWDVVFSYYLTRIKMRRTT